MLEGVISWELEGLTVVDLDRGVSQRSSSPPPPPSRLPLRCPPPPPPPPRPPPSAVSPGLAWRLRISWMFFYEGGDGTRLCGQGSWCECSRCRFLFRQARSR
ncbi:hypothetical protein Ga0100231_000800 [Opitutaceae bacterium TAV4]|nr:hypothetical protein Ga0100231_000800 [Opitutaceae bacterium TAV4]